MGEYATRFSDGEQVKIGTCSSMYYLRYEDRAKVDYTEWEKCSFRLPLPAEDKIRIGEYGSCWGEVRLIKPIKNDAGDVVDWHFFKGDDCTLEHAGIMQIRHESGMMANISCYHGQKLPTGTDEIRFFYNGMNSDIWRLVAVSPRAEGMRFVIECRYCRKCFLCSLDEIIDYVEDKELAKRLRAYCKG